MLAILSGAIEAEREAIWEYSSREEASAMSSKPERDSGIPLGWKERDPLRRLFERDEESDQEKEELMDPFKGPLML
jgi:hypothetical protein